MFPPHLPPPTCSLPQHNLWKRLRIILASTAFGLLAGLTGAAIMLGWLWPRYGEGDVWTTNYLRLASNKNQLEEKLQRDLASQILNIYSKGGEGSGVSYLNSRDKLGPAVLISSDGWLIMMKPKNDSFYASWRALSHGGAIYKIDKAITDPYSGVLYLKIGNRLQSSGADEQERFKVITFANAAEKLDDVFVLSGDSWQRGFIDAVAPWLRGVATLDGAPATVYALDKNYLTGAMVVNSDGHLAGLLLNNNLVLPAPYLARVWPKVLSGGKVTYASLGAEGWFSFESPILINGARLDGWLATRITNKKSALKIGDVIMTVNGQPATPQNYWEALNASEVRLKIWRAGQEVEVVTPVLEQK